DHDDDLDAIERHPSARMQSPVEPPEPMPSLKPDLHVVATNVPIDADLLAALPKDQREWLSKAGVAGRFDLEGVVSRGASPQDDVGFDFGIKLHDASMWPINGVASVTGLTSAMHLTPAKVVVESLEAHRGDATIDAHGSVGWAGDI